MLISCSVYSLIHSHQSMNAMGRVVQLNSMSASPDVKVVEQQKPTAGPGEVVVKTIMAPVDPADIWR
jgi:hypothetical protein